MNRFAFITILTFILLTSEVQAQWLSASHLGFATQDASTTGFENASGSYVGFSIIRKFHPRFGVGLKTLGSGATQDQADKMFRLSTLAQTQFQVFKSWVLSLGLGVFKEQGEDSGSQKTYESQGKLAEIAWHRFFELSKGFELGWGGYYSQHWGDIDIDDSATTASLSNKALNAHSNTGSSHGIEFILSFKL